LGGGAVFFDIIQKYNIEKAFLFDINEELILVYNVVKHDIDKLIRFLQKYKDEFLPLNDEERKTYYYNIRKVFNSRRLEIDFKEYSENWIPRAAQTIFLNKTCFNGLFRFNRVGEFNVPMGSYKTPKIFNEKQLISVSKILQNVTIESLDFNQIENFVSENSFIYFDPPFRPISKTSSFTSYTKMIFDDNEQKRLAETFKVLDKKGSKLMLSNSDEQNGDTKSNFFDNLYAGYNIHRVLANRMINCIERKEAKLPN
jgi:DNA adenine methylase